MELATLDPKDYEVILIKRGKANEAVSNHQEVFMVRAENLAGLACMPYLPHTASTSRAEKLQKTFPLTRTSGLAGRDYPQAWEPQAELPS
jgi:hypothetical protein